VVQAPAPARLIEGGLAELITSLAKGEREGSLRERLRFLCRPQLLIVDEIGYLPVVRKRCVFPTLLRQWHID
jgi:DNA replication protein DnaC